jgi:hypothetical protein
MEHVAVVGIIGTITAAIYYTCTTRCRVKPFEGSSAALERVKNSIRAWESGRLSASAAMEEIRGVFLEHRKV